MASASADRVLVEGAAVRSQHLRPGGEAAGGENDVSRDHHVAGMGMLRDPVVCGVRRALHHDHLHPEARGNVHAAHWRPARPLRRSASPPRRSRPSPGRRRRLRAAFFSASPPAASVALGPPVLAGLAPRRAACVECRGGGRARRDDAGDFRPCAAVLACALGGAGLAGCTNIPGMPTSSTVQSVVERGPYLDVEISQRGATWRYFAPAKEPCRSLLKAEAAIDYVSLGPLGQFQSGQVVCDPVGIGSLAKWRDQRPRPQVGPLPARQADYRLEYEDPGPRDAARPLPAARPDRLARDG